VQEVLEIQTHGFVFDPYFISGKERPLVSTVCRPLATCHNLATVVVIKGTSMNFKYFLYGLFLMVAMTLFLVLSYFQTPTDILPSSTHIRSTPVAVPEKGSSSSSQKIEITRPSVIPKKKIAYAITITKDGPFLDGALVLGYSAQLAQQNSSKYSAELIAFVTPEVVKARLVLAKYGWKIIEKNLPVELQEIQNEDYMNRVCSYFIFHLNDLTSSPLTPFLSLTSSFLSDEK
jgi:hypothetical protein